MPIERCSLPGGGSGFRWGASGKCYPSRAQAERQGAAAHAAGFREKVLTLELSPTATDEGEYELGVEHKGMLEVFLHGKALTGRHLLEYTKEGSWRLSKPGEQRPLAQVKGMQQVVADLVEKGDSFIIWALPGGPPRLIDIQQEDLLVASEDKVEKQYYVPIAKLDEDRRLVYGVVLEPDVIDSQNDVVSADEIEQAAHRYLERARVVGKQHKERLKAVPVESYIAPVDFTLGGEHVRKGSWVMVTRVDDAAAWAEVKAGQLTGYSIGGVGLRQPTET